MHSIYYNKNIFVTGAVGTIGSELVKQLITFQPREIRLFDNNESDLFVMAEQFKQRGNVVGIIGDIRDRLKTEDATQGVDIIFHLAGLKHVFLCEYNPMDAVQTNIIGTRNIIFAAKRNRVERVLYSSSDKAVNPTNVMGTTKLMGERLMTAANIMHHEDGPIFSSSRFGNVVGSRGSVVPIFKRQILLREPVTLTDPEMTRFIMTVSQAAGLVIDACALARGGEVFVSKMPVVRIEDLAKVMIDIYKGHPESPIQTIGRKPGEKLFEELMNTEEMDRAIELQRHFVIPPAFKNIYKKIHYEYVDVISDTVSHCYTSAQEVPMSFQALKEFFMQNQILENCPV